MEVCLKLLCSSFCYQHTIYHTSTCRPPARLKAKFVHRELPARSRAMYHHDCAFVTPITSQPQKTFSHQELFSTSTRITVSGPCAVLLVLEPDSGGPESRRVFYRPFGELDKCGKRQEKSPREGR